MLCSDQNTQKAETQVSAYVADAVDRLLSGSGSGEVLMVNSSGIYLSLGGRIVFLCDAEIGPVPIGISLESFSKVTAALRLAPGQCVYYRENALKFVGGSLRILKKQIESVPMSQGQPRQDLILRAGEALVALGKTSGLSMLALPLVLGGESSEVSFPNPYAQRAYPVLCELLRALSSDGEAVRPCVTRLLGLGTGLTPSADDVLLGMLYAFRKLGEHAPRTVVRFREVISELADKLTGRVSAAYLHAIIDGAYFERMERLWQGLSGDRDLDISCLTVIGSNSGSEMLLGVLLALKISRDAKQNSKGES